MLRSEPFSSYLNHIKMRIQYVFWILIVVLAPLMVGAQSNKKSKKAESGDSYVLADLSYMNDAVFMGRRDSIAAPYVYPSIGYYDKSGFFVDASASYLTASEANRVDLFLTSVGYTFDSNKISGGISGTLYLFNEESYNVSSEILGDITAMFGYDFKAVELTMAASSYFNEGSSADFFAGLLIDRTFYSADNKFWINPGISLYAGSQYFYQEYYRTSRLGNRKGKGSGSGGTGTVVTEMIDISEAEKFNLLNVEFSLPLKYYHNQFIFAFNPVLALPQNSATITTETEIITEDLEPVFYWSLGVSYWFKT